MYVTKSLCFTWNSHNFVNQTSTLQYKIKTWKEFPGGPVVKTQLQMQAVWVWPLVRSHMLRGMAKNKINFFKLWNH